jgi:hypothetical protein
MKRSSATGSSPASPAICTPVSAPARFERHPGRVPMAVTVRQRDISCNGGGEATAGKLQILLCGRSQTQDSLRRTSGHAAQIRGSEHDHRRLKASPPPLHDHNLDSFQHRPWGGRTPSRASGALDKGHQSKNPVIRSPRRRGRSAREFVAGPPAVPRDKKGMGT